MFQAAGAVMGQKKNSKIQSRWLRVYIHLANFVSGFLALHSFLFGNISGDPRTPSPQATQPPPRCVVVVEK